MPSASAREAEACVATFVDRRQPISPRARGGGPAKPGRGRGIGPGAGENQR
ncbi:MAG: hypothetical protein JNM85_02685 [Chthonomonas sp.]|nr:hypothetical protein [Chthonomonas sp.]